MKLSLRDSAIETVKNIRNSDDDLSLLTEIGYCELIADSVLAALAKQAQPLTDKMIEAEARTYDDPDSAEVAMRWARDRMAQQAQPEMPTREMIDAAYAQYCRGTGMDRDDFEDAALTLFHKNQ